MRRSLFVLIITMLLLRGWMGGAMATGMAADQLQHLQVAAEFVVATNAETEVAITPDCTDHASDESAQAASGHCDVCSACQACYTVALAQLEPHAASLTTPSALPHSPAAQFASAVTALGQKPPIS